MGVVSEIVGDAGARHRLPDCNGKAYFIGLITQAVRSAFERAMFDRARRAESAMREDRDPNDYSRRLDAIAEAYRRGEFGLLSQGGLSYFASLSGAQFLLNELVVHEDGTRCTEDEVFAILTSNTQEVLKMVNVVLKESFPGLDFVAKPPTPDEELAKAKGAAHAMDKSLLDEIKKKQPAA